MRQDHRIQPAVLDWYGPTDFLQMEAPDLPCGTIDHDSPSSPESRLVSRPIQTCSDAVARANPITYVTRDDPPFLIQHSTEDCSVPPGQGQLLYDALRAARVPSALEFLEGQGIGGSEFSSRENMHRAERSLGSKPATAFLHNVPARDSLVEGQ